MCCFLGLFCRLGGVTGFDILTLCLFRIQCACVHDFLFICICAMFHILCIRVCVGCVRGIIAKMLCICYRPGYIVLAVHAVSFYFHCTRFSLIFSESSILLFSRGFS